MQFHQWKWVSSDIFFIEFCSLGCNWWEAIIGLDNGLAQNRWQAITQTNNDPVQQRIYTALGRDELISSTIFAHSAFWHQAITWTKIDLSSVRSIDTNPIS